VVLNVSDKKGGSYGYLINYWYYSLGLVVVGFIHSPLFGRADLYSTCYWSYFHYYLAATKSIQTFLTQSSLCVGYLKQTALDW
jgi:hypothetical protein